MLKGELFPVLILATRTHFADQQEMKLQNLYSLGADLKELLTCPIF
jgi:hypothetical protein